MLHSRGGVAALLLLPCIGHALLAGPSRHSSALVRPRAATTRMLAFDPAHLHHTIATTLDAVDQTWLSHVASGLADATAAVSDGAAAVAEEVKEPSWFDQFVTLLENTIKGIDGAYESVGVHNAFGLSIATFTIAVKLALLPLNYIQLASAEKMQQITPVQKKIGEMYPNDKATQQVIVARLYEQVSDRARTHQPVQYAPR
jgi:membrane protein insertase Oxa1/YidC/SpoIIIJ